MVRKGLVLAAVILDAIWCITGQRLCPRLQKPWNGQFIGDCQRNIGAQCMFQCRHPYILVGSSVRVCRADGTWSGSSVACELDGCTNCDGRTSNCVSLYNPNNGFTEGQCTPGIVGEVCIFWCHSGYSLQGNSRTTCLEGGQWSSSPPSCIRTSGNIEVTNVCPTLVAPDGGRLVGSCTAANTGDTCQLVCLSGYRPTDTRVLICQQTGRWSDSLPRCVQDSRSCPVISVSQGSARGNCGPAQVGHICTITCNSGYTLSGGSGTLVCQANGEWSGNIPTCTVRTCPALPPPVSGGTSGTCNPGQVGQSCSFYCNSGFELVGQSTLTCGNDGRWSGNSPYCTAGTCPNLDAPANGARSGSCNRATVGQSCSFSCQAGYVLNGQSTVYCQAGGRWSSSVPTCTRVTCPTLNPPANGDISGSCAQAAIGQSCTFVCRAGYTLNGSPTLYCQDGGRWSSGTPSCVASPPPPATTCASLGAPNNGFMSGTCAPGRVGQSCVFGCYDGFVLRGQQTLVCLSNGQWSNTPPQCERSGNGDGGNCPVLNPPPNGEFLECDNRPGGQCITVCANGYSRSGSRVRTCLASGMWSGYAPTCTRTVGYTTYTKYKVVPLWRLAFG